MLPELWNNRAQKIRVIDGDTIFFHVDRGRYVYTEDTVRLLGVNTADEDKEKKRQATEFTKNWVNYAAEDPNGFPVEWPFILHTEKDPREKYGRLLARVIRINDGRCLNDDLLAAGFGKPYDGKGLKPE